MPPNSSSAADYSDLPPYMQVPLSRIAAAPADTIILLDMSSRLEMHGIHPADVECIIMPVKAQQVQDAMRAIEEVAPDEIAKALHCSVLPKLKQAGRRLLRLSPDAKSNFDADCALLCLMEHKLGGPALPIFYYQEPSCANTACRAAQRSNGGPLLKCSGCSGMALYCSKDCQLKDRPTHKQHCKLAQLIPPEQMQGFLQAADLPHTAAR